MSKTPILDHPHRKNIKLSIRSALEQYYIQHGSTLLALLDRADVPAPFSIQVEPLAAHLRALPNAQQNICKKINELLTLKKGTDTQNLPLLAPEHFKDDATLSRMLISIIKSIHPISENHPSSALLAFLKDLAPSLPLTYVHHEICFSDFDIMFAFLAQDHPTIAAADMPYPHANTAKNAQTRIQELLQNEAVKAWCKDRQSICLPEALAVDYHGLLSDINKHFATQYGFFQLHILPWLYNEFHSEKSQDPNFDRTAFFDGRVHFLARDTETKLANHFCLLPPTLGCLLHFHYHQYAPQRFRELLDTWQAVSTQSSDCKLLDVAARMQRLHTRYPFAISHITGKNTKQLRLLFDIKPNQDIMLESTPLRFNSLQTLKRLMHVLACPLLEPAVLAFLSHGLGLPQHIANTAAPEILIEMRIAILNNIRSYPHLLTPLLDIMTTANNNVSVFLSSKDIPAKHENACDLLIPLSLHFPTAFILCPKVSPSNTISSPSSARGVHFGGTHYIEEAQLMGEYLHLFDEDALPPSLATEEATSSTPAETHTQGRSRSHSRRATGFFPVPNSSEPRASSSSAATASSSPRAINGHRGGLHQHVPSNDIPPTGGNFRQRIRVDSNPSSHSSASEESTSTPSSPRAETTPSNGQLSYSQQDRNQRSRSPSPSNSPGQL